MKAKKINTNRKEALEHALKIMGEKLLAVNEKECKAKDKIIKLKDDIYEIQHILAEEEVSLIREQIKTFDDAIECLGEDHPLVKNYRIHCNLFEMNKGTKYEAGESSRNNYLKAKIVIAALNQLCENVLIWYFPSDHLLRHNFSGIDDLKCKTPQLAQYCEEQFGDLWNGCLNYIVNIGSEWRVPIII